MTACLHYMALRSVCSKPVKVHAIVDFRIDPKELEARQIYKLY